MAASVSVQPLLLPVHVATMVTTAWAVMAVSHFSGTPSVGGPIPAVSIAAPAVQVQHATGYTPVPQQWDSGFSHGYHPPTSWSTGYRGVNPSPVPYGYGAPPALVRYSQPPSYQPLAWKQGGEEGRLRRQGRPHWLATGTDITTLVSGSLRQAPPRTVGGELVPWNLALCDSLLLRPFQG